MLAFTSIALLLASTLVGAAPHGFAGGRDRDLNCKSCDLKNVYLDNLPTGQTLVPSPGKVSPKYVAVGVGIQNYTCSAAGAYTSTGAVAALYDISCLAKNDRLFDSITTIAYKLESAEEIARKFFPGVNKIVPMINHFFVPNPTGAAGVNPRFNLEPYPVDHTFSTLKKSGNVPSPDGSDNVDWLLLTNLVGGLAQTIYRTDTVKGQPPASCKFGTSDISVRYAAKYWVYE